MLSGNPTSAEKGKNVALPPKLRWASLRASIFLANVKREKEDVGVSLGINEGSMHDTLVIKTVKKRVSKF